MSTVTEKRLLTAAWIARKIGWKTHRVRRWLKRTGAGEKVGREFMTTKGQLRVHFPQLLDLLDQ